LSKEKQRLSTFLVVKNEVKTIRRALESVLGCTDEYVIGVDRKSDDGTLKAIRQFKKIHPEKDFEIYRFTWQNDFSKARNEAIRRCTGDWIFQLDGHEYLYPGHDMMVLRAMVMLPEDIWLLSIGMDLEPMWDIGAPPYSYIPEIWFIQHHLWRNDKGIHYVNASHNAIPLDICSSENRQRTIEIKIVHDRPADNAKERREQRRGMNIPNFIKELRENPDNNRAWFYLGMSYADAAVVRSAHGDQHHDPFYLKKAWPCFVKYCRLIGEQQPEEAYEAAAKIAEISGIMAKEFSIQRQDIWPEIREAGWWLECHEDDGLSEYVFRRAEYDNLLIRLRRLGIQIERWHKRGRKALYDAIRYVPTRAEGYFNLGEFERLRMASLADEYPAGGRNLKGDMRAQYVTRLHHLYQEAERWYKIAAEIQAPVTSYFLRAPIYIYVPFVKLAELNESVYYYTGESQYFQRAKHYYEKALSRVPEHLGLKAALQQLKDSFHNITALEVQRTAPPKDRPGLAVFDSTMQFTGSLVERWSEHYEISATKEVNYKTVLWGDVVFCEWCDKNLIALSERDWQKPIYARLWRYEAYEDLPRLVNWDHVTGLVLPNQAMRRYFVDTFGPSCSTHVIYPGVDFRRLAYKERTRGTSVAIIAYLHERKGLDQLAEIVCQEPGYKFHVAGHWQSGQLRRYFWWRLHEHKERNGTAADRVFLHGWQSNINKWLELIDANYLLSCSWGETFGFNIAEAMAKGIKPIIRRFEGCDELWPMELIFNSAIEACGLLHEKTYDSAGYREWVAQRFDADREAAEYLKLFKGEEDAG